MAIDESPFNLSRFLEAQAGTYASAVAELRAGWKRSHWMWFVFPQLEGLGMSEAAHFYGIKSLEEAHAYLRHPLLGPRIVECTDIVNHLEGLSARQIFGTPDDLKFHSSMTLFELVAGPASGFAAALDKYYGGERDGKTLELLRWPESESPD